MNPLFNILGGGRSALPGNIGNLLSQFQQFKNSFRGDPKQQIQQMVKLLLHLDDIPRPDDAADGLALAICHANTARMHHQFRIQ